MPDGVHKGRVYKFSYMRVTRGALTIPIIAGESYMGFIFSEDAFVLELREDGTATMSVDMFGQQETTNGTWAENAEDSGMVDLTFEGETMSFECYSRRIYWTMDGAEFELVKQ